MAEYLDVHLGSLPQLAAAHESVAGKWQGWPQGGDAFLSDLRNSHGAVSEPIAQVLEQYQQRRVAHAADQAGAHQQVSEAITASLKTFRTQEEQNADRLSAPTVGDGVAKATDDQQQTKIGDTDKPKDPKGQIQAVDFDKNHAPAPLGPSHEIQKILPRWTDQDLYPHKPSAADIHQDTVGDCYLAATMGAIAHANPQWIKDRIHYNEQTTSFDVTLNHPGFDAHLLSREGRLHHAKEVRRRVQGPSGPVGHRPCRGVRHPHGLHHRGRQAVGGVV